MAQIKITHTSNADMNIGVTKQITMAQQTAVDWLAEKTAELGYVSTNILEQAKQMEKEQIIKAIEDWYTFDFESAEQYYNETYEK